MARTSTLQRELSAGPLPAVKDNSELKQDETTQKIRLSLDVSPELNAKIEALARDMRGTKSDVLRKSLALLDVAVQARKAGQKIGIAERSEQLSTEIIGFEY